MLKDVIAVKPIKDYQLHLTFEDGKEGIIDLAEIIEFSGIFEPLKNSAYFASVRVDPELGTICWDNGADIDPVVLYAKIANQQIPIEEISDSGDYLQTKDELFAGETVDSLYEKIQAFTKGKQNNPCTQADVRADSD